MLKVYLKELLELTRDKKTLIFTILLPILVIPVIMIGFGALSAKIANKAVNENLNYTVIGQSYYPELSKALADNSTLVFKTLDKNVTAEQAIKNETIRFAIIIPDDTPFKLTQALTAEIEILYNDSSTTSRIIFRRVESSLETLEDDLANKRISALGLSQEQGEGLIEPIKLIKNSTANKRESIGEKIGGFLPYILILLALSGAMYPAIDLGVGEKERGTLETLLLTPIPRFQIVFAKFLVIFTTSFLAVFLSLLSFALIITVFGPMMFASMGNDGNEAMTEVLNSFATISILDILLMFLMLVPTAAIFASLLLSVSIYARTFKEAQTYMSPLMMISFLPVVLAILPGVKLDWVWASVPLTNVALAIKEIFKGTIDYNMLFVIFGSTTLVAGALLYLCSWWFQREQVLFRN
ncbi:MAG: sodium transport system permease protein [Polaribacter sp.]|jgi:sodium transport system permease protein